MYHVFSEKKVLVAKKMKRTLKEKCERIKTECMLQNKATLGSLDKNKKSPERRANAKYHLVKVL